MSMTSSELVQWMEDEGWSVAGLVAALVGTPGAVSESTLWRYRRGQTEIPGTFRARIMRLRVDRERRRVKQRSRWPSKVV